MRFERKSGLIKCLLNTRRFSCVKQQFNLYHHSMMRISSPFQEQRHPLRRGGHSSVPNYRVANHNLKLGQLPPTPRSFRHTSASAVGSCRAWESLARQSPSSPQSSGHPAHQARPPSRSVRRRVGPPALREGPAAEAGSGRRGGVSARW